MEDLAAMVPEVKGYVGKGVALVARLRQQRADPVGQVPLVLGLAGEGLAAHAHDPARRVVAGAGELDELLELDAAQLGQLGGRKVDDNLRGGRVLLAEVGGVAEAQRPGPVGWGEGGDELCVRHPVSIAM